MGPAVDRSPWGILSDHAIGRNVLVDSLVVPKLHVANGLAPCSRTMLVVDMDPCERTKASARRLRLGYWKRDAACRLFGLRQYAAGWQHTVSLDHEIG